MTSSSSPDAAWYAAHGCDHAHCPTGHAKPQPALLQDGRMVCMRCLVLEGVLSPMIPCTPETCPERHAEDKDVMS